MSNRSLNGHIKQENRIPAWVWFEGATALKEGQGVCYNWDYGTATAKDGRRFNRVELPTILNARYFAGVAARAYSAKSGGQFIEVNVPGSVCNILCAVTSSIGVGVLTCEAGGTYAGYFRFKGFQGEGSAVPLQTVTGTVGTPLVCLAKLQEGEPSGLVENVAIATTGGAIVCMVGGVTYFPANTLTDADATFTVADGTICGQKKGFVTYGNQTTNNIVLTFTSGMQNDANAALATWTTDTDLEECYVTWLGNDTNGVWMEQFIIGGTIA